MVPMRLLGVACCLGIAAAIGYSGELRVAILLGAVSLIYQGLVESGRRSPAIGSVRMGLALSVGESAIWLVPLATAVMAGALLPAVGVIVACFVAVLTK